MDSFLNSIKEAKEKLSKISSPIRIISSLEADGLASAAILTRTLIKLDKPFAISSARKLTSSLLNELKKETYENYFFLALGSDNLKEIDQILKNRNIFILDNSLPENTETNFTHLNPSLHNLDKNDISSAGIAYFLSEEKELSHLALVGAIGEKQELTGLNNKILQDSLDKVEIKKGLKMFDSHTKPLYKVLQFLTNPYIPGITGSESESIKLLQELGIDKNVKPIHLSEPELKKLITSIILKRMGSETEEDVLGDIYLLKDQETPLKDLKEFSNLLKLCGKLNRSSLGIGTCLGDEKSIELATELVDDYKNELINSLNWFYENRSSTSISDYPGLTIINAEDNIKDNFIGTVTSIISKSNIYKPDTTIISLAHTLDNNTKISMRISGENPANRDPKELLNKIAEKLSLESNSLMPQEKEQEFIEMALEGHKTQTESFITPVKSS